MKTFSEKFGEAFVTFFIVTLLVLASPIIFIWLFISTTKDYFRYKKSRYYLDTSEKYSWLCADSNHVAFYNDIKDAQLPINYYRNKEIKITGYGYFIYKDSLLLCDYDSDTLFFDKENDEWLVYDEHDYLLLENEVKGEIKTVNEFLGEEICKKAIIFVERDLLKNSPEKEYDNIEFLSIINGDKISALKNKLYNF